MKKLQLNQTIYIEGAQSTGKTYLLEKIKEKYVGIQTKSEYARKILAEKQIGHENLEKMKIIVFLI